MTLERKIAGRARNLVSEVNTKQQPGYRSLCESLPVLLRTAGLAQATAFLKAKSEDHKKIYEHMETQFRELGLLGEKDTLIAKTTDPTVTMPQYRMLLEMAMLVAFWHKRMAQALIEKAAKQ